VNEVVCVVRLLAVCEADAKDIQKFAFERIRRRNPTIKESSSSKLEMGYKWNKTARWKIL
jgi:hypothetical protein